MGNCPVDWGNSLKLLLFFVDAAMFPALTEPAGRFFITHPHKREDG
jgi:hypothetical protein